jgi:stage II sporulation protein AB (anti-sigma F factor)
VAAFVTQLDPTLEEVADIKTAVSEAVTNAIIHGYPTGVHTVVIRAKLTGQKVELWITDEGVGIPDVARAMEPLYTTRPDLERSGMGFMFMEAFMDQVQVESTPGLGTTVYMSKQVGSGL